MNGLEIAALLGLEPLALMPGGVGEDLFNLLNAALFHFCLQGVQRSTLPRLHTSILLRPEEM